MKDTPETTHAIEVGREEATSGRKPVRKLRSTGRLPSNTSQNVTINYIA